VLEFIEVKGHHLGEELALRVKKVLKELKIKHKLFAITGNNTSNNSTLCYTLFAQLKHEFIDTFSLIRRP
jgi:predicted ABC-class ATPase